MQENNSTDAARGPRARPLDAEALLERWRQVPPMDPESLRRDIDAIIDQSQDGPSLPDSGVGEYRLSDRTVGRPSGGDPLESYSWQELRDISYDEDQPTQRSVAAGRGLEMMTPPQTDWTGSVRAIARAHPLAQALLPCG